MPTYEYRCSDCGHEFDAVQSFSDDALTECPECQGELRKKFGAVGISFKGSGFYKNDSRATSSKSSASSRSESSSKADAGGSTGSSSGGSEKSDSPSTGSSSSSPKPPSDSKGTSSDKQAASA